MSCLWLSRTADRDVGSQLRSLLAAGYLPTASSLIVHDLAVMKARWNLLSSAFPAGTVHAVAVKANPLLAVLKVLVQGGAGLEVASSGELALALAAGCPVERIVLDSPAKTEAELRNALDLGVRINANSVAELERIERLLREGSSSSEIGLRLNPVVAGEARESATMVATLRSKFGVPAAEAVEALRERPWVHGLHVHIGSQVATLDDLLLGAQRVAEVATRFPSLKWVDIGGGLPTRYAASDTGLTPADYVEGLRQVAPSLFDYPLLTEVGRALHAGCGWAVSRVEYADAGKAVVHLGADFALREAYQPESWFHEISVFDAAGCLKAGDEVPVDLYGPLCFSGDCLARGRLLPPLEPGDLVVLHDVGGYTLSMWSRYCSRPMPRVVGWTGEGWTTLREPETPDDLVRFWS